MTQFRQASVAPVSPATIALDILALAILSNALIPLLLLDETALPDPAQQGSLLLRSLNTAVYALYALRFFLNPHARNALRRTVLNDRAFWLPVAALLALAVASMGWASEPQIALRRAVSLIGTAGVGMYLALRYPHVRFLQLLLGVSAVFALCSIAMVILWPAKGMMQVSTVFADVHAGRWRGIFQHKNHLASLMAVGIVVAAATLRGRGSQLYCTACVLLLCVGVLLKAESLTALLATVVALLGVVILRLRAFGTQGRRENLLALFPMALLLTSVALYQYNQSEPDVATDAVVGVAAQPGADLESTPVVIPASVGFRRDVTATGRWYIWRMSWDAIQREPLRGYGYGVFWRTEGPAEQVWQRAQFRMPHAHNGWLELALQLGIPVTLLMAGWMLWLGARILRGVLVDSEEEYRMTAITLLGLWICLNVQNLAESVLFRQHEILSVLIFSVAVSAMVLPRPGSLRSDG